MGGGAMIDIVQSLSIILLAAAVIIHTRRRH